MKVLFLAAGDETVASSRVRVYGYLPFLSEKGIKYKILSYTSQAKIRRIIQSKRDNALQYLFELCYKIYRIFQAFVLCKRYDVIFVQKVLLPKIVWSVLRALDKRIIYDFDDAVYIYNDMSCALKSAKLVITSNKVLGRFASKYNRNVYELASPVDIPANFLTRNEENVTLGWIGSPESSKYLTPLLPTIKSLKGEFKNLNIEFMGAKKEKEFEFRGARNTDWSIEKEKEMLKRINIGIMPLEDDEWSRAKAGYKLLLYMSYGIPCVASPYGINTEIVKDGSNGYLAKTQEEWLEKLSLLIGDIALRKKIGQEARRSVEKSYSYKANYNRFIQALKDVCRNEQ